MSGGNVLGGLLLIAGGVAVFEMWRRGYLAGVVDAVKAAAAGKAGPVSLYKTPTRPFRVFDGGGIAAGAGRAY